MISSVVTASSFLLLLPAAVFCSVGDRSNFYQRCLRECLKDNCRLESSKTSRKDCWINMINFSTPALVETFRERQPLAESLLAWDCQDECR